MDRETIAVIGFSALFVLLFIRVPVGLAMMIAGGAGIYMIRPPAALPVIAGEIFGEASNYPLTILPLFILMGNLAGVSGMSRDLYDAAHSWFGHLKGGLASATIVGCAGFSALSGSSLAAALTMGRVSLPEMQRYKYDDGLATGAVAAGGTLGILIPPSAGFVVYAILTEESIGRLFMAGILPGIILTLLFIGAINLIVSRNPDAGPQGPRSGRKERMEALWNATPILAVVLVTIGGMYTGFFTPVEASAVGAFFTFIIAVFRRSLDFTAVKAVLSQTLGATATVFLIIIGAFVFIPFMSLTELSAQLVVILTSLPIGDIGVLLVIILAYMFLGMFLESMAMLVLTIPVVIPIAIGLNWDLIWFGIIIVIVLEMGMISPPVGINVFIVKSIAPDVPMGQIFRGIWPFWFAMAFMIFLLIIFPQIALFLPEKVVGG